MPIISTTVFAVITAALAAACLGHHIWSTSQELRQSRAALQLHSARLATTRAQLDAALARCDVGAEAQLDHPAHGHAPPGCPVCKDGMAAPPARRLQDSPFTAGGGSCTSGAPGGNELRRHSARELEALGRLFAALKFSEKAAEKHMDSEAVYWQRVFETDNRAELEHNNTVHGLATQLLSVDVSDAERASLRLSAPTVGALTERLERWGVVALPKAVPRETSSALAARLREALESPTHEFGGILADELRHDYPLPVEAWNVQVYEDAVRLLAPVLTAVLGADARLCEYSSLTSMPGAGAQRFHPDVGMDEHAHMKTWAKIYSVFVYLDDVAPDMAALDVRPGTHTDFHFLDKEEHAAAGWCVKALGTLPAVRMAVPAGTIVIMDSRTHHRGSANTSPRRRPVFYFSMMSKQGVRPDGPTYSMRKRYEGKLTMEHALAYKTLELALETSA